MSELADNYYCSVLIKNEDGFGSMDERQIFSEVLIAYCERKGLKKPFAASLSRRTGFHENTVKKWFGQGALPSILSFYKLVSFFGEEFRLDIENELDLQISRKNNIENNWMKVTRITNEMAALLCTVADPTQLNDGQTTLLKVIEKVTETTNVLESYKGFIKQKLDFKKETENEL